MGKETAASMRRSKIGVLDSGVGGLTVVRELERLLPNEEIIYYGDNNNCPYGNRGEDEIVEIAHRTIDFLIEHGAGLIVVACNTTSSLLHRISPKYAVPIFGIISPVADVVARSGVSVVGVIATELTIRTGIYEQLIHQSAPEIQVVGEPSRLLAALVDRGDFDMKAIAAEVERHMDALMAQGVSTHVIYGCTHYPIVSDVFERCAPGVSFINPAAEQAKAVSNYLAERELARKQSGEGMELYTTGPERLFEIYRGVMERLGIETAVKYNSLYSQK